MYKIYSNSTLIHDQASPDKDIRLVDPVLSLQDNAAGKLEFIILPSNPGYDSINRMNSTIIVKKENKTIWTGRVIQETNDFFQRKRFVVEGALSFLNDIVQPTHVYTRTSLSNFIRAVIDNHNAKVPLSRQIQVGIITVSDYDESYLYETYFRSTWEELNDQCINRLGGHIRIRYNDNSETPILDYLEDYPNTASQSIDFGKNLLDFTRGWDLSDLSTVIIPRGAMLEPTDESENDEYLTVESVNGGSIYVVNQQAYNTYGRIEKTVDFPEIEDPITLLDVAELYVLFNQFDKMTMSVNAVDMHRFGVSNPESFNLLDEVRCVSNPHGLDRFFPITAIDLPLDRPQNVTYTMGSVAASTISSVVSDTGDLIFKRIKNLPSLTNTLKLAKTQAAAILNQRTTGYVTITEVDDNSEALIISQTKDWRNSNKRWIFNMNGLGYTKDGGQTYDIAMTMDGTIVADFVKTGLLEDGVGNNYWNLSTGEFSLSATTKIGSTTVNDLISENQRMASAVLSINNDISDIQNQLDGNITTWFYSVDPTTSNVPASSWNTNALKEAHLGDLYYNTTKGYCWRWMKNGNTYSWQRITDTDVTKALADAAAAQDTADHKRRVFVATPIPPYDVGDLWVQGTSGDLMRCKTAKSANGTYSASDWVKATKYTDDSAVSALDARLNQQEVFNRLTKNGALHGIFMENNDLYINATYLKTGIITDNKGKNYWDLDRGEFSLQQNIDIGGRNYINGTYKWTGWGKKGGWSFSGINAICASKATQSTSNWNDRLRSPLKKLKYSELRGYKCTLSFEATAGGASTFSWGTKSVTNQFVVVFTLFDASNVAIAHYDKTFTFNYGWKKYKTTFTFTDTLFKYYEGKTGVKQDMYLGLSVYNRSPHTVSLRRVKLEKGSQATDWCISWDDTKDDAKAKADAALDTLTQYQVMKRLTNNFSAKGIWLKNNKLYMNASYITAGVITDSTSKNSWNLDKGIFKTKEASITDATITNAAVKNSTVTNSTVTGSFTCGSDNNFKMVLNKNGRLTAYRKNKPVGYIDASADGSLLPHDSDVTFATGMEINGGGFLGLSANKIGVAPAGNDWCQFSQAFTGRIELKNVVYTPSAGKYETIVMWFENGLFIGVDTNSGGCAKMYRSSMRR